MGSPRRVVFSDVFLKRAFDEKVVGRRHSRLFKIIPVGFCKSKPGPSEKFYDDLFGLVDMPRPCRVRIGEGRRLTGRVEDVNLRCVSVNECDIIAEVELGGVRYEVTLARAHFRICSSGGERRQYLEAMSVLVKLAEKLKRKMSGVLEAVEWRGVILVYERRVERKEQSQAMRAVVQPLAIVA